MTLPLIFSDPYSGVEILCMKDGPRWKGVICNPIKISNVTPWLSTCPHCIKRRGRDWSITIRRLVSLLCTLKIDSFGEEYLLPNDFHVLLSRNSEKATAVVHRPGGMLTMDVTCENHGPLKFQGEIAQFRSPILLRALKMLFGARTANESEVRAFVRPLLRLPQLRTSGRVTPCKMLRW